MMNMEQLVRIGTITKTHGTRGEVNFTFTDDVWDTVETDHLMLIMDGLPVPFFMEEYRFRSESTAIVSFEDINTQEQAQALVGSEVWMERALTEGHEEEYTWHSLVGYTIDGVGRITEVDDTTENILFGVGETLIPAAEDWITDIDHETQTIYMELPEGLLDLQGSNDQEE